MSVQETRKSGTAKPCLKNDVLLPAREVRRRFGQISPMTLWRWLDRGILPPPTKINGRNFWPESAIREVQQGQVHRDAPREG